MSKFLTIVIIAVLTGLALYFFLVREAGPPASEVTASFPVETEPEPPAEPAIKFPLPQSDEDDSEMQPEPEPLPQLGPDSDTAVQARLADLVGPERLNEVGLADDFLRRLVVTVDGLTEQKLPVRVRPLQPIPGSFMVSGDEDNRLLSAENYKRYDKLVVTFSAIPTPQLIAVYRSYYPLFQEAYEELGYGDAYFNDRLIEVIDHLLATPSPKSRIALTQPRVMYQFADPELEALSSGQKLLIRIGPGNATLVRQKLAELREALTE